MNQTDLESIIQARNNVRCVKKYHKGIKNDTNLNTALEILDAVIDRNYKPVLGLAEINAAVLRKYDTK